MTPRNARTIIFVFTSAILLGAGGWLVAKAVELHRGGALGMTYQQWIDPEDVAEMERKVPFLGALLQSGQVQLLKGDSPAARAGIETGDRIVAVDGVLIRDQDGLARIDQSRRRGDRIRIEWLHGDERRSALVTLETPFAQPTFLIAPGASCFVALAYFLIGALVLWARKEERSALVFHVLTSFAAVFFMMYALYEVYMFSPRGLAPNTFESDSTMYVILLCYAVAAFAMTSGLLHFALVFPRPLSFVLRYPRVIAAIYVLPLLLILSLIFSLVLYSVRASWAVALGSISLALLSLAIILWLFRERGDDGWAVAARKPLVALMGGATVSLTLLQLTRLGPPLAYPIAATAIYAIGVVVVTFGSPLVALVLFINGYRGSSLEEKRQLRWPLFGLITALGSVVIIGIIGMWLGFTAGFSTMGPSTLQTQVTLQSIGKVMYLLIPVSFAFGILKYRLMEIDVVIRKTLVYSIVSGLVLVVYLILVGGVGTVLVRSTSTRSDVVVISATLVVALAFIPLRNRVQTLVDRTFYRNRASLPQTLRALGTELNATDDPSTILRLTCERLAAGLNLEGVSAVCVSGSEPAGPVLSVGDLVFDVSALTSERAILASRVPSEPSALSLPGEMATTLRSSGVTRIVAPVADRGVVAIIATGRRRSGETWGEEDDEFVAAVAERMALSLESARLRLEEEEFRQAQTIQRSLLPSDLPQLERARVAGIWRPARAVGGDYYDAIRFDDRRLGVCIGDVVGKGMPAALLMSSLQAGVRAIADSETAPARVVDRVRRVVVSSLDRGKFITFFYGVVDIEAMEFRYTNAGHNPPIVVSQGGDVTLLEVGGPALARLFREQEFTVGVHPLTPGDRIVMFTDGLTETADRTGEPYGDDRLIEMVRSNAALSARELQKSVLEAVLAYSGGTLDDDLTLMVIEIV